MNTKEPSSFTDVFNNPDDFKFMGLNTAKYFYDLSLVKARDLLDTPTSKKGLYTHAFLRNPFLVVISLLKFIYLLLTNRNKVLFYGNPNRYIKEGNSYYDSFNFNIVRDIGLERTMIIQDRRDSIKNKIFSPNLIIDDLTPLLILIETFCRIALQKELHEFKVRIGRKMKLIGLSEDECISKLLKFYSRYLFFSFFLSIIKPKSTLVICHYSKHAYITACKQLKFPVIELMHGHILPTHKYYYNPKIQPEFIAAFRKWSLPDKIAVYGDFWKKIIIEGNLFSEDSIIIIGYYQKLHPMRSQSNKTNRKNTILIASDGIMQSYFLEYLKFLKSKLDKNNFKIIIKLHPSEDGQIFKEVIDNQIVFMETNDIHKLFNQTDVLISVFSSVLFEATLYNLRRYSLFIPKYQDQYEQIIKKTGVAERLEPDQLPDFSPFDNDRKRYFLDTYNFDNISHLLGIEKTK